MNKILLGVGGVIVLAVAGVFIFLATFDINQYRPQIIAGVKDATGRDLSIDGDLELSVSLSPTVRAEGIRLTNASWGSEPHMVEIEEVEANLSLLPLLTGSIQINLVDLKGADILLETSPDGTPNWEFDTAGGAPAEDASSGSAPGISIGALELEDIDLTYRDGSALTEVSVDDVKISGDLNPTAPIIRQLSVTDVSVGQSSGEGDSSIEIESIEASASSNRAPIALTAIVEIDDIEVEATGEIGPVATLVAMDGAFPVDLLIRALGQEVTVDVEADLGASPPKLTGAISADTLDLSALPPTEEAEATDDLLSDDLLPLDGLNAAEVDLQLSVGEVLSAGGPPLRNVAANIRLANGQFDLNPLTAEVGGGTLTLGTQLNDQGRLRLTVNGDGITGEQLVQDMELTDLILGGETDINVNLAGQGRSAQALASSLNGKVLFDMGSSQMKNELIDLMGADILTELLGRLSPFGAETEYTVSECVVANFRVTNGVMETDEGIAFVTDRMEMVSHGDINLTTERIDLSIRPKAKEGIGIGLGNLTQIFKISGPLADPGLGVDAAGAARTGLTVGAAVMTGGLSVLAQGAKERMVDTADDPCAKARTWDQASN